MSSLQLPSIATSHRKIAIAIDLSDESAFAVRWAVQNYLRPGDSIVLLHVTHTSVLYGADWGAAAAKPDFDDFALAKANDIAKPLAEAGFPYTVRIVKDHDLKERLCLEVERLGLSAMIMGSRGFGSGSISGGGGTAVSRVRVRDGKLGSVSNYCVQNCVRPVIVVRYPDDKELGRFGGGGACEGVAEEDERKLNPVSEVEEDEEEEEYHDVLQG